MTNKLLSMFKGCESSTRTFLKCEKPSADLKLIGLNILMQQYMLIVAGSYLWDITKNVSHIITHLYSLFSFVYCKVIEPLKLDELEDEIIVILYELEMFFPPFF